MGAGGGDGQRALDVFLAAHVREIAVIPAGGRKNGFQINTHGIQRELPAEKADGLGQTGDGNHFDAVHHAGFRTVVGGQEDAAIPLPTRKHGGRKSAFDGPYATVQGQFACDQVVAGEVRLRLPVGQQNSDGHGQIVDRAFLAQVGGGEVDDGLVAGELVAGVGQRAADPLDAFFHGGIRQTDDGRPREAAVGDVHLHLDWQTFNAVERGAV